MLRKVLRDLTSRKLRTLLVVLSVAIGVFGISGVGILSSTIGGNIDAQFKDSNPPDITITTSPISPALLQQLRQTPNVTAVDGTIVAFAQWKPKKSIEAIQIVGVQDLARKDAIAHGTLKSGAFPKPGEVLFENGSLKSFGLKSGQTISISGPTGDQQFKISGSAANINYPGPSVGYATVFLNTSDAAKLGGFSDPNSLFFKLKDIGQAGSTSTALRSTLASGGAVVNTIAIRDPANPPGKQVSGLISTLLGLFAVIALVTSSFLVVNTVSTVVTEQRGQIGAMKAVGATNGIVMRVYLTLSLLYGIMGTIVGLILGIGGSALLLQVVSSALNVDVGSLRVSPGALVVAVVVGIAVPLLAALLPVWLGSRVTIREAIMSYGVGGNFGKGILAKLTLALSFLPLTAVLASRNLLRNRLRVVLTVVGLAVAGACTISVYNANVSLGKALDNAVQIYNADIVVSPSEPVPADKITAALASVPGIKFSEGWFNTSLSTGTHLSDVLNGVPVDTKAYNTTKVSKGRWFTPQDTDAVIITEAMQRARNYKLGDTVPLTIGSGTVNWKIVGVIRDLTAGDSTFIAPIAQAWKAAGAPTGIVQTALIKLNDDSHANIDKTSDQINAALTSGGIPSHGQVVYKTEQQIKDGFTVIFVLLTIVVIIVAIVGGLGLFGTITMNVLERQREIGILRSVGASTGDVLAVFMAEGLLLGFVGWIAAVVLGLAAVQLLSNLFTATLFPVSIGMTPFSLALTLIGILVVAFLAALLPSISAARTRVAQILRYA